MKWYRFGTRLVATFAVFWRGAPVRVPRPRKRLTAARLAFLGVALEHWVQNLRRHVKTCLPQLGNRIRKIYQPSVGGFRQTPERSDHIGQSTPDNSGAWYRQ